MILFLAFVHCLFPENLSTGLLFVLIHVLFCFRLENSFLEVLIEGIVMVGVCF